MEGRRPSAVSFLLGTIRSPLAGQRPEGEETSAHGCQDRLRSREELRWQGCLVRVRILLEDRQAGEFSRRVTIDRLLIGLRRP